MKISVLFLLLSAFFSAYAASPQDIFYAKCSSCHGSALSLKAKKTESQWMDTIKRMKKHGLDISGGDAKAVAKFLSGAK